jgi:Fur family ferric uptake transcriptional regulator
MKERWLRYLSSSGLKTTRQRRAIFDAFAAANRHVSLDELLAAVQEQLPSVGYATVYRTMKLFVDSGVASERQFGDGQARYEAVFDEEEHHDHVICINCGAIFEFEDDEIERRQAAVAERFGLRIVRHRLDIWGECIGRDNSQCKSKAL